jgi:hypothetical protein
MASEMRTALSNDVSKDLRGWGFGLLAGKPTFIVYNIGGIEGHIYSFDNNSFLRGPGGSPTQPCGGPAI